MADAPKRQQRTERLDVLDTGLGKVYIERRNGAPKLYARAHIQGGYAPLFNTGKTTITEARAEAGKWFQRLYQQAQVQKLHGHKFNDMAEAALKWLEDTKQGELSPGQIKNQRQKWSVLTGAEMKERPEWAKLFDGLNVENVDYTWLAKFRDVRKVAVNKRGTPITNATLRKDMLFFRLVLKYALEVEHIIQKMPAFPEWRGTFSVKKNPTPYLTLTEYMHLMAVAKKRAKEPNLNPRVRRQREELRMFVALCVCSAFRVGEAESVRWCDCTKTTIKSGGEKLDAVLMWVFGKHGKRTNKREKAYGLYHAVQAYDFLKAARRPDSEDDDPMFDESHNDGLTDLLKEAELWEVTREDGSKDWRNARSFRHTGISLWIRFAQNPNLDDIATWARTKRVHIEDFYNQNPIEQAVGNIAAWRKPKSMLS